MAPGQPRGRLHAPLRLPAGCRPLRRGEGHDCLAAKGPKRVWVARGRHDSGGGAAAPPRGLPRQGQRPHRASRALPARSRGGRPLCLAAHRAGGLCRARLRRHDGSRGAPDRDCVLRPRRALGRSVSARVHVHADAPFRRQQGGRRARAPPPLERRQQRQHLYGRCRGRRPGRRSLRRDARPPRAPGDRPGGAPGAHVGGCAPHRHAAVRAPGLEAPVPDRRRAPGGRDRRRGRCRLRRGAARGALLGRCHAAGAGLQLCA
mmetsp:Transcript_28505/g.67932  ORF Transcript_28505/g.67932 Transcript_28505/m.67932 type:complete len:261 (-) Transcript_28505:2555-3337(-)